MDHIQAPSPGSTKLLDRTLWYDGASSYDPARVVTLLSQYPIHHVDYVTPTIAQYNRHVSKNDQLTEKTSCILPEQQWVLPSAYRTLDVIDYLFKAHDVLFGHLANDEREARETRLAEELILFKQHQLIDVLRTIIWIINTLSAADTVWGVGRGSSVSSYVLFVIGVHDVDSYSYQLDIADFLHY